MNYSESDRESRALDSKATGVYDLALTTVAPHDATTSTAFPSFIAKTEALAFFRLTPAISSPCFLFRKLLHFGKLHRVAIDKDQKEGTCKRRKCRNDRQGPGYGEHSTLDPR